MYGNLDRIESGAEGVGHPSCIGFTHARSACWRGLANYNTAKHGRPTPFTRGKIKGSFRRPRMTYTHQATLAGALTVIRPTNQEVQRPRACLICLVMDAGSGMQRSHSIGTAPGFPGTPAIRASNCLGQTLWTKFVRRGDGTSHPSLVRVATNLSPRPLEKQPSTGGKTSSPPFCACQLLHPTRWMTIADVHTGPVTVTIMKGYGWPCQGRQYQKGYKLAQVPGLNLEHSQDGRCVYIMCRRGRTPHSIHSSPDWGNDSTSE
ncbi:hypothetical protein BC827DRAFT_1152682 [Russula dissimulans]|nr:hypothetical protein BC827DRAFT_1152682 [Russula dissimulans]